MLVTAPRAAAALDKMQRKWAATILGCRDVRGISWHVQTAQCGWEMKLSTKVKEAAIVARARLYLLPQSHPTAKLFEQAKKVGAWNWEREVHKIMQAADLPTPVPEIWEHTAITVEDIERARHSAEERRNILRHYRWYAVRPILRESDQKAYLKVASKELHDFGMTDRKSVV